MYHHDGYLTSALKKTLTTEYVVDLGANIGTFAALWHERNPNARIACVEVNPALIPALQANVGEFATVIDAACHYDKEPLYMLDALGPQCVSSGGSRVVTKQELDQETDPQYIKRAIPLKTVTLEQVCRQCNFPRIDVLKLDVEGSEYSILEHCDLSKIGAIVLESHPPASRFEALRQRRFAGWYHRKVKGTNGFDIHHLINRSAGASRSP